ncbi:MAG: hypothetical protein QOI55_378, partial [Actinomycetota bacterium]|nr:hypothetical protein [Actinomycetota bacterium]
HDRRTRRRNPRNARRDSAPQEAGDEEHLLAPDADAEDDGEILRVVKAKQFEVKPMPVEEAALQMELLGHDFFLFTSAESGRASVIYRRRDGLFGLIEATG